MKLKKARKYAGNVSDSTFRKWLSIGLPYSRTPSAKGLGSILIKKADLDAFLESFRSEKVDYDEIGSFSRQSDEIANEILKDF